MTDPLVTVSALIARTAAERPAHRAFIQGEATLSYRELDALMDRVAAALQQGGIAPTEAIAVCASNSIAYAALYLGALRAGVAVAPLSPSSKPEALATMVQDAAARLFFVDAAAARLVDGIALPPGCRLVTFGEAFEAWLAPVGARPAPVQPEGHWPFNIIY